MRYFDDRDAVGRDASRVLLTSLSVRSLLVGEGGSSFFASAGGRDSSAFSSAVAEAFGEDGRLRDSAVPFSAEEDAELSPGLGFKGIDWI